MEKEPSKIAKKEIGVCHLGSKRDDSTTRLDIYSRGSRNVTLVRSTVDKDGNAVATTTSINDRFGACLVSESTGILSINQMDGKLF